MTIREITEIIELDAPLSLAEESDRMKTGFQLGALDRECSGVTVCLDCTESVVKLAVENGCNLILSHHPLIYFPIQEIDLSLACGRTVAAALKADVTVYSAHTNFDKSPIGLNAKLVSMLGGNIVKSDGCLFFADVQPITVRALAKKVSELLNDNSVRVAGNLDKVAGRICVCSGAGGSDTDKAFRGGADVYITGDVNHHSYLFAEQNDFAIVEYSHYSSEIICEKLFAEMLSSACDVKVVEAHQRRPFRTLEDI